MFVVSDFLVLFLKDSTRSTSHFSFMCGNIFRIKIFFLPFYLHFMYCLSKLHIYVHRGPSHSHTSVLSTSLLWANMALFFFFAIFLGKRKAKSELPCPLTLGLLISSWSEEGMTEGKAGQSDLSSSRSCETHDKHSQAVVGTPSAVSPAPRLRILRPITH